MYLSAGCPTAEVACRTCEAELTVCFGERLEKWLVEGLKITLQKAARDHLGENCDLDVSSLLPGLSRVRQSHFDRSTRQLPKPLVD